MKIPKEIVGENKLRDACICLDYIQGYDTGEIKERRNLNLSIRRIEQIIYANSAFVNPRVAWPKTKRVHIRQSLILKKLRGEDSSKKDVVDQLDSLRDEIEGNKPLVDQSTHKHYTIHALAKEVNADTGRFEANADEPVQGAGFVLAESVRRESLEQAGGDHAGREGSSESNGKIS